MNWTGLALRLEKKFGLGENPFASRKVYRHVERLCHVHGDPVYVIVRDMVDYADRARKPGNTFRGFVLKRIEEHGFDVDAGGANQTAAEARERLSQRDEVLRSIGHAAHPEEETAPWGPAAPGYRPCSPIEELRRRASQERKGEL